MMKYQNKGTQQGVYAVEFAIVGSLFFILLIGIIELGRLFFAWNILTEATRRTVRLATVCHLDQSTVTAYTDMINAGLFNNSLLLSDLSETNLQIQYLDLLGSTATTFSRIRYVRANIINYQHQMLIPGLSLTLNSPSFSSTLPRESLGVTRYKYTQCSTI